MKTIKHGGISTYLKVAIQWLNKGLCFYQSLFSIDNGALRNCHLRLAANRYQNFE